MIEQDNDDLRLLDGDVTTRTKDRLPSIHFSDRVHQLLYQGMSRAVVSILKSIRDTIGKVIKLDVNTGNAQRGRFVPLGEMNQENLISDENRKDLDMFGPWMVVNRRNSILSRKSAIGREERKVTGSMGSRFNIIHDLRDGN
ncbi:hypothetical protein Gotri_011418 [Gossypium trilobum]|uniref:Uncharacterized protein n=1 Tax=Gossypium trilobum TaxID=34281 RepID=A0A7J9EU74_9ROSI|nr:hypothetical protein [Gossypium trilobum]